MAITVKHNKVSTIPDDADTSLVRPSDWNADHTLTGTVPVANGGTGASTASDGLNNLLPSQTSNTGKVLSTDGTNASWIAAGGTGTVTSVSGTAPVSVATGTTTPVVSLASGYGDTQNPYASKTANYVLASPDGSTGVPTFRALASADIPSLTNSYIPYTGATGAVDLNAKTLVNVANLGVNTTTVPTIKIRAIGDNNSGSRIAMRGYSSDANSSSIRVTKFRGTASAPQAPQSGDSLGKFELAGYGTTSSEGYPQASIEGVATEAWGATARGTKALVKVTPNTTTTQVTALTIDQDSKATFANTVTANGVLLTGNTGTVTSVAATAGTGITVSGSPITTSGTLTITNSAPDQTVVLTAGTGISTSGTYPNFTITNTSPSSGGTVTSVSGTTGRITSTGGNTPVIDLASGVATAGTTGSSTLIPVVTIDTYGRVTGITTASNPQGTVTSVTGTAPVVSSGGATPAISMAAANTTTNGYLTSTDWNTFNGKGSGTVTSVAALTLGTTGTDLSSTVATGTTTPVITLQVPTASATNRGALSAADWSTFNGKGSGTVTSASVVSANGFAGTVATATTTPAITISTSITGVLKGNATAISAATAGTDYSAGTSALTTGILKSTTTTGALTIAVAADFPTLNQNTTGSAGSVTNALTAGTGLTATATYNGSAAITFNATGTTINSQTAGYTLVAGDAGKTVSITTGGVTIPNAVMAAGNIVSIYNNSGSSQTITQGTSLTLQWAGQTASSTGNRTLSLYGLCTIVFISSSVAVITGSGLT